jgi:hypothetical protein
MRRLRVRPDLHLRFSNTGSCLLAATKADAGTLQKSKKDKEGEELDQVAGNAEDEIGDRIAGVRETELLYGPESLLAVFGPMLVYICGSPKLFKVCLRVPKYSISLTGGLPESHPTSGRDIVFQQVPMCQLKVLRRKLSNTIQDP